MNTDKKQNLWESVFICVPFFKIDEQTIPNTLSRHPGHIV